MLDRCPAPGLDPLEAAVCRESQRRADALLDALPDEQRQVVALKVLGGLTLAEIAAVVGCPLGTAKSRLLYGLRKIAASLAGVGRGGGSATRRPGARAASAAYGARAACPVSSALRSLDIALLHSVHILGREGVEDA